MLKKMGIGKSYDDLIRRKRLLILLTGVCILLLMLVGLALGPSSIQFRDIISILRGEGDEIQRNILLQIRLPRLIAGLIGGITLSVSGVVMQSVLRNPLGSPFTLGISNSAAFGAAFAVILFGAGNMNSSSGDAVLINNPYLLAMSAFFWSLVACFLILMVARARGASPENMILAGIIANFFFAALTTALQYIADDVELAAIVFWTFGDLSKGSWFNISIQTLLLLPLMIYFYRNRWNYNALGSGDDTAVSLGVNIGRLRLVSMVAASLATALVVSFYGIIAFVGLVVPHMVRRIIGSNETFLIPGAALAGAAFMIACDILARVVLSPIVLPVGILTSLLGAPLFVILLLKKRGGSQWK